MDFPSLRGRSILVVEDEPLIAFDIATALEQAGANATTTTTVRHALILAENDGLSAAILCARLKQRGIPYVSYSGYDPVEGASKDATYIAKPASMDVLMGAVEKLLAGRPVRVS